MQVVRPVLALLIALPLACLAEIRHVPTDYPTIQAGIDAAQEGDTVRIEPGVYAEALRTGLQAAVTLQGASPVDSLRPVIDPTALPGADTLSCLVVRRAGCVLEDLAFRNGTAMYPRENHEVGGVNSAGCALTVRRCRFDSTHNAIYAPYGAVTLEQCEFRDISRFCVMTAPAPLVAEDCDFHGFSSWSLIQSGDSTRLTRCRIANLPGDGHLVMLMARGSVIEECVVGPFGPSAAAAISPDGPGPLAVVNNVFSDCRGANLLLFPAQTDTPSVLRGNVFTHSGGLNGHPTFIASAIRLDDSQRNRIMWVDSNQFIDCQATAFSCRGPVPITRNRFVDLETRFVGAVSVSRNSEPVLDNLFQRNGRGLDSDHTMDCDARWNWWGDSTGPFHEVLNPEGRGDTVTWYVRFDPWHTDTLFWLEAAPRRIVLPQQFSLTVYPNPFNHQCRLKLEVPRPEIVRVELYDVLGRHVADLWSGAVGIDMELAVDGSALASGVYFARASDTISGRTLATVKLALLK